jgi:hypothetical protein
MTLAVATLSELRTGDLPRCGRVLVSHPGG